MAVHDSGGVGKNNAAKAAGITEESRAAEVPPPPERKNRFVARAVPTRVQAGFAAARAADAVDQSGDVAAKKARLRIVAANLTTAKQSYRTNDAGSRILKALNADVVLLQEARIDGNAADDAMFAAWVRHTFGPEFHFVRGKDDNIPNAIISRYPFKSVAEIEDTLVGDRDHVVARIDIPGPKDLLAVSVHLVTRNARDRQLEGEAIVDYIKHESQPDDLIVVGGDMNTDNTAEGLFPALRSIVMRDQAKGPDGDSNTNMADRKPYDHVLASPELHVRELPIDLGGTVFPTGLVVDTVEMTEEQLAALPGVERGDARAAEMQHMAVVRDFSIENDPED